MNDIDDINHVNQLINNLNQPGSQPMNQPLNQPPSDAVAKALEKTPEQTKADLKNYGRAELLEVILLQSKENDALKEKLAEMETKLAEMEAEIARRRMAINEAGNIAEASLKLSNIFQEAELAVHIYKENIERLSKDQNAIAQQLLTDARVKADTILAEANREADTLMAQAKIQSDRRKLEADNYWNTLSSRLVALYDEHKGLRELVGLIDNQQKK